jgi:sortase (surface protein transpeptidase)
MTNADTTTSAGHRWGRYALSAVIVVLTALAVTAISRGVLDRSDQPPLATAATDAPPPDNQPAAGAAGSSTLTTGALMTSSAPTRVSIPTLKVNVPVIALGQQDDGSMQVPADATTVGWYTKAPTPGALGPAVLAGHVDYQKQPGTFAHLADLKAGDPITVNREDGSMAMFAVTKVGRYAKNKFPSTAVYGPINHAGLRLITCGGDFDNAAGHYKDNIVVYATLTMAHPA